MEDGIVVADAELRADFESICSGMLRTVPEQTIVHEGCAWH
jgi:hypothetical protein